MKALRQQIAVAAPTTGRVLIYGEMCIRDRRGGLLVVTCKSLPPISIIFFKSSLSVIPAIAVLLF